MLCFSGGSALPPAVRNLMRWNSNANESRHIFGDHGFSEQNKKEGQADFMVKPYKLSPIPLEVTCEPVSFIQRLFNKILFRLLVLVCQVYTALAH